MRATSEKRSESLVVVRVRNRGRSSVPSRLFCLERLPSAVSSCKPGVLPVRLDCDWAYDVEFERNDGREVAEDREEKAEGEDGSTAPPQTSSASPRVCLSCARLGAHPR